MTETLEPRQRRSRHTRARLLKAAVEVLNAHGLDGATIPRIADAAGVAPASVYRRFRDKDALMRAVFSEIVKSSEEHSRNAMQIDVFTDRTFSGVASELIRTLIRQYRTYPGLMRSMLRFAESDADFRSHAITATANNFRRGIDLLAQFSDEIAHRDPSRAITFALLSVATIIEARILEPITLWDELHPVPDDELHAELTRMFLAYLK